MHPEVVVHFFAQCVKGAIGKNPAPVEKVSSLQGSAQCQDVCDEAVDEVGVEDEVQL